MNVDISKIGWSLLREQKNDLIIIQHQYIDDRNLVESIEGILSVLDYIQDQAVASGKITEKEVFGKLDKDECYVNVFHDIPTSPLMGAPHIIIKEEHK